MFDCLFTTNDELSDVQVNSSEKSKSGHAVPPKSRLNCGLAGIENQGATCYLNSLLQTLLLTPEFRESLFLLTDRELGSLQNKDASKVRVIPLQLQKLFARLLLSDQQSVSTAELTDSFGWTNHEELQQHDVQELNRILFSAIEDSLVGTSGKDLIQHLYHGTIANQITCAKCGRTREREENFLDLCVTVAGNVSLENGLQSTFCDKEAMTDRNQYKCENCKQLVDATKGAKVRLLPNILTVSLLRFSFDFKKMERYKDSDRITFPSVLDMSPYCDIPCCNEDMEFELFSVVIHRGGAYGGHYHAYIRDVDSLGNWVPPDEDEIRISADSSTGELDIIDCTSPVELIQAILTINKGQMTVDKLCAGINKHTGVSWNKRFRRHYGPIIKFFEKYSDRFQYDRIQNMVKLADSIGEKGTTKLVSKSSNISPSKLANQESDILPGTDVSCSNDQSFKHQEQHLGKRSVEQHPTDGFCWFDFDDSRVKPILTKQIEKQFSGKESAYMLFYRRKSLRRVEEARSNPAFCIPDELISEILAENLELQQKRQEYEIAVNKVCFQVHFSSGYSFKDGALKPVSDTCNFTEITLDRRKTVADLKEHLWLVCGELMPDAFEIHVMKDLLAGFHLYQCISENDSLRLIELNIVDGCKLFVWDGKKVQNRSVLTGEFCEPLYITVIYGEKLQASSGFSKNMTLRDFRNSVSQMTEVPVDCIIMKRIVEKDTVSKSIKFTNDQLKLTLNELKIRDGDSILVENKLSTKTLQHVVTQKNQFYVRIENHCVEISDNGCWPTVKMEVKQDYTVGELKALALSKFGVTDALEGGRLRVDHETLGLRAPLHEELSVVKAGLSDNVSLILQHGPAPQTSQITLTFAPDDPSGDLSDMELLIEQNEKVETCLRLMLKKADISDSEWHLRKTNWCGEAAEVLNDLDLTLEQSLVGDGDHLLLVRGTLPPKGYLRLPVWLHPPPVFPHAPPKDQAGLLSWISSSLHNIMTDSSSKVTSPQESVLVGDIDVPKESTLEDLKYTIMTLPKMSELSVPSAAFIRVWLQRGGVLSSILRLDSSKLQRLNVNASSIIAVQVLDKEEKLGPNEIVLTVKQRIPYTKCYSPGQEFIWDTDTGISAQNIKQAIAEVLQLPADQIVVAKHFKERFEWMVLQNSGKTQVPTKQQRKKKRETVVAVNLKKTPYNIKDGDVIGVKDLRFDPGNDFSTPEDEEGKERLKAEAEEKKKMRADRKKNQGSFIDGVTQPRRPEVELKIKVEDFL